jgi:hypothetical protein
VHMPPLRGYPRIPAAPLAAHPAHAKRHTGHVLPQLASAPPCPPWSPWNQGGMRGRGGRASGAEAHSAHDGPRTPRIHCCAPDGTMQTCRIARPRFTLALGPGPPSACLGTAKSLLAGAHNASVVLAPREVFVGFAVALLHMGRGRGAMADIGILSRTKRVSAQERLAHIHDVKARTIGVRRPSWRICVQHPIASVRVLPVGTRW